MKKKYFYLDSSVYTYNETNKEPILNQYVLWIDDLNISHLRGAQKIF